MRGTVNDPRYIYGRSFSRRDFKMKHLIVFSFIALTNINYYTTFVDASKIESAQRINNCFYVEGEDGHASRRACTLVSLTSGCQLKVLEDPIDVIEIARIYRKKPL
jgi:hypothetical protein